MSQERVRQLLESVRKGSLDVDRALESLSLAPFVDTPNARVDPLAEWNIRFPGWSGK